MESTAEVDWTLLDWERVGDGLHLQASRTSDRLNQIDHVRANGIGDRVALLQIVVCGDQSAGKSSVLEGISGIPFPRQDVLCIRFATEIILRHDPNEQRTTAMIIPHDPHTADETIRLEAFRQPIRDFSELPGIIEEAAKLMGVRGHDTEKDTPAFSADILRLELVGKTGLYLTIVDLPELISVSEVEDVRLVENLVDSYLENLRTIILAVVPASSDIDTEGIIQRARHNDKVDHRTVGIITKPDLINAGTEARVVRLANNSDATKLRLDFFLVKKLFPAENGVTHLDPQNWPSFQLELGRGKRTIGHALGHCRQVIERHIVSNLPSVFDPTTVSTYTDEDMVRLAVEKSCQIRDRRVEVLRLQGALE